MAKQRPHEALVQVWYIVTLDDGHDRYTDQEIRAQARLDLRHRDSFMMDEDAPVSRDTETWCDCEQEDASYRCHVCEAVVQADERRAHLAETHHDGAWAFDLAQVDECFTRQEGADGV
jgi:hypothetical protein